MKKYFLITAFFITAVLAYSRFGYLANSYRNQPSSKSLNNLTSKTFEYNLPNESDPTLNHLKIPLGFKITYFADDVPGARSMTLGNNGIIYVGTRGQGVVYALPDINQDGRADERHVVASRLNNPNGVAYHNGDLYVTEINRIIKFTSIDNSYNSSPSYSIVYDKLPDRTHHGWRYTRIGPDGRLYLGIGAPCNVCQVGDPFATIVSLNLDGTDSQIVARGIRNTVGFDWNPQDNSLWFTDNGRDNLGDHQPADELNRVGDTTNFGFPHCHAGSILDPDFGRGQDCNQFTRPVLELGPHVAALGMNFYRGSQFPSEYQNRIFIAEHGSWNSTVPVGYRIMTATVEGDKAKDYREFLTGFIDDKGNAIGRPVDFLELPDGSLLISDDKRGAIYRVSVR